MTLRTQPFVQKLICSRTLAAQESPNVVQAAPTSACMLLSGGNAHDGGHTFMAPVVYQVEVTVCMPLHRQVHLKIMYRDHLSRSR